MVEQSHTNPWSICKEYLDHPLGLTLSTPGLDLFLKLIVWFYKFFVKEKYGLMNLFLESWFVPRHLLFNLVGCSAKWQSAVVGGHSPCEGRTGPARTLPLRGQHHQSDRRREGEAYSGTLGSCQQAVSCSQQLCLGTIGFSFFY